MVDKEFYKITDDNLGNNTEHRVFGSVFKGNV